MAYVHLTKSRSKSKSILHAVFLLPRSNSLIHMVESIHLKVRIENQSKLRTKKIILDNIARPLLVCTEEREFQIIRTVFQKRIQSAKYDICFFWIEQIAKIWNQVFLTLSPFGEYFLFLFLLFLFVNSQNTWANFLSLSSQSTKRI